MSVVKEWEPEFSQAGHTIVLSDVHLADAEPPHPTNPLWKRFKQPQFFIDGTFRDFLHRIQASVDGPVELILNGDIFDFDSVMVQPHGPEAAPLRLSWLEKRRGLSAEEPKSRFKLRTILEHHVLWCQTMRDFVRHHPGNRLVFIIGNHDMELHWPSVREDILDHLGLTAAERKQVRFCEWFYISNGDTLVEHGNQYDSFNLSANPVNPLIRKGSHICVRIPFGNLAGKFMLNGMGLMNPHANSSYIKSSLKEYLVFYFRYVMRTQPMLFYTWFWSAMVTLVYSIAEGLLPAMTDPLTIGSRIEDIAHRANATPRVVLSLKELHAHPAVFNPFKVLRELWLDRAILLILIVLASFEFFSVLNVFAPVSFWWFLIPMVGLMPLFVFYARSVESEVDASERGALEATPMSAMIAGVKRVIHGHTHREGHTWVGDIEHLNTGTWSPAYHDVECTQPYGRKCFAWIKPSSARRTAELLEWVDGEFHRVDHTRGETSAAPAKVAERQEESAA